MKLYTPFDIRPKRLPKSLIINNYNNRFLTFTAKKFVPNWI